MLKRKTKRTLPLGQYETFAYDVVGRQSAHTDLRGKTTTMTYDSRDRILTKVPDPSLGEPSHAYVYSPTGMRLSSVDGSGTTTYTYDLRDRMLTKAATAGTLTYTYDATGNVATIRSSNANGTSVDYAWDAANHLASVTDNRVGGTTTAAYTSTNRPLTLTQPNGIGLTYSYDALDRVTSMLWRHGTAPAFASWAYTHNERGQRLSSKDITGRAATYTYDPASRLATETINGDPRGVGFDGVLSYVLDGGGNRITRTSTVATLATQTFSYDGNDQLSTDAYDANGNTVAAGGHVYAYDFEDRLISTDNGTVTIAYDCDGNRVAKTAGGINTRYVVDDSNPTRYAQVLEETVGGAVQARYTYGTRIVSQTRNVAATPATDYFGFDGHGNITFLTDSSGAVTDSYDYDAWGNVVGQNGSTPNTRLFAGEEFDSDLGFINLRARYFNPRSGRFITSDPMPGIATRPMGLNRYLYGSNDPVGRVDPAGLASLAEDTIFIRYVVGALLFTTATIVVGNTKATIPSVSYPAAKISCAFMGIATGLSSAIVDGYTWVPGLCAIRLPWTKDKPKVESVPGREAICGPQPPFYPPECDKVGDDAYDECYPVVQNVEYCLEQRQVVVDACLETEEEEKMKYAQRFLEWERCMGIRPPNR